MASEPLKLYELINPSDCYTFRAPNLKIAACCAVLLSSSFGACCVDPGCEKERTPVLLGWSEWLAEQGIDNDFVAEHSLEIADAWDSFLIGNAAQRRDIEEILALIPDEDARKKARDDRQDRNRSSMCKIGEAAYQNAEAYRKAAVAK